MAELNAAIAAMEKGGALDTLYNRLLSGFKEAQNVESVDYTSGEYLSVSVGPDGVAVYTADEAKISAAVAADREVSMKNAAYLFASSFVGASGSGGGGSSGVFVSLGGDTMTGRLRTLYGFEAGYDGIKVLDVYGMAVDGETVGVVHIDGELRLGSHGLYINGQNVISHDNDVLSLDSQDIALNGDVTCSGSITLGGVVLSSSGISFDGKEFYHSGNANRTDVSWTMDDGTVAGSLVVGGTSTFSSVLSANNGVELGVGGVPVLSITQAGVLSLDGDLDLHGGLKLYGDYVIRRKNASVVSFSAPGRVLALGDDGTGSVSLQSDLFDDGAAMRLVSKYGDGWFPNSFKAGHALGSALIETYKASVDDSGIVFSRYARFGSVSGPSLYGEHAALCLNAAFTHPSADDGGATQTTVRLVSSAAYTLSGSLYAPSAFSPCLAFGTEADFFEFLKPVEGKISFGIAESKTKLADHQLFFDDGVLLQALGDGVKHYGNIYAAGTVGSQSFSSGLSGSGWRIGEDKLTHNVAATFDELTVRKKMRVYDLEVRKQSVSGGSLWISDCCCGDTVEELL